MLSLEYFSAQMPRCLSANWSLNRPCCYYVYWYRSERKRRVYSIDHHDLYQPSDLVGQGDMVNFKSSDTVSSEISKLDWNFRKSSGHRR